MGNVSEFERVANLLISTLSFEQDINVSVFETNIRGMTLLMFVFNLNSYIFPVPKINKRIFYSLLFTCV